MSEESKESAPLTAGELIEKLSKLPPDTWIFVDGHGSAIGVSEKLGANEPFVIILGTP